MAERQYNKDNYYELVVELDRQADVTLMLTNELKMYDVDNKYVELYNAVINAAKLASDLREQAEEVKKHDAESNG